eukprot:TRINITY_DN5287_c0_g2_i1.p1 TRINITY_DN5287_c0_g2~~TRINITY_DN5287_c0_g2_i1.p1  ORF type:complete len:316 (-),score=38.87 TRINITY_DN5287_c0_g2_i1:254-1201(-)
MQTNSRANCSFCEYQKSQVNQNFASQHKLQSQSKIKLRCRRGLNVVSYQQSQKQQKQKKIDGISSSSSSQKDDMFNFVDTDYLEQLIHVQSMDEQLQSEQGGSSGQEIKIVSQLMQQPPGSSGEPERSLPTQGEAVVQGGVGSAVQEREIEGGKQLDIDYLQELIAIQQNGPKNIGFFGSRNMGFLHQQLVEVLSYAIVLTGNHVFTSGATGTNAAVIRGALRAEKPELLTVVLPQSLKKQPQESQELLQQVERVIEMPQNDELVLIEASRICNKDIINRVVQIICFAFHDSSLLLETCREAKQSKKMVTLFYLD